jgi:hypothetical protein
MSDAKRFQIANLAMTQVMAGGHYLEGARGAVPGTTHLERTVTLKDDPLWDTLRVHAAANSLQTCYGRWHAAGGYLFQPGSTQLAKLKEYVAANKSKAMSSWPHFEKTGMFPRRLGAAGSSIALGDDCRGKRHFDCIGFIYWVLHEIAPAGPWKNFGIANYARTESTYWDHLGPLTFTGLKYGDIVTRPAQSPHHIGFISLNNKVVHAKMEGSGVVMEDYSTTAWPGGVSRIRDARL